MIRRRDLESAIFRIEETRDAEVEQLRFAFGSNENVAWFEIAVDDKILMRELHRRADFAEKAETRGEGKFAVVREVR